MDVFYLQDCAHCISFELTRYISNLKICCKLIQQEYGSVHRKDLYIVKAYIAELAKIENIWLLLCHCEPSRQLMSSGDSF